MRTLNFLYTNKIYSNKGNYYISRPLVFNELAKHLNLLMYGDIIKVNNIDKSKLNIISNKINVKQLCPISKIKGTNPSLLQYPTTFKDIVLCYLLRKEPGIIWVKANPIEYHLSFLLYNKFSKLFYKPLKLVLEKVFDKFSTWLFKGKLVFYTGDITFDKLNNKTQFSIVSSVIKEEEIKEEEDKLTNNIIFVGNITKQKGIDFLIKSMLEFPSKTLNIVGDGPYYKTLKEKYQKIKNIHFLGPEYDRKKLLQLIHVHDILVMPSLTEKQGKVQLEAMSQGVPVIASDLKGIRSVIKDNENGVLVKPASSEHITIGIIRLYNNHDLYEKIKINGYKTARKNTMEAQVEFMVNKINEFEFEK